MADEIHLALTVIGPGAFERFCCALLSREYRDYENIEPGTTALGKTRKGACDAHVRLSSGKYVAFIFTTQQTGVRSKILQDITKLSSDGCHFRDKISDVVVCLNTPLGSEEEAYRQEAEKHGWQLQVFSLDTIAKMASKYVDLCRDHLHVMAAVSKSVGSAVDRLFDCGHRIKKVRRELELSVGEFVEQIGYRSERQLQGIEQRQEECPDSLVQTVAAFSGVSPDWLKHGREPRYPVSGDLDLCDRKFTIEMLRKTTPSMLFFCVDLTRFEVLLLVQSGEYHWTVYDPGFSIDFWNWIEDYRYIPRIYHFMNDLHEAFFRVTNGRVLSKKDFAKLLSGETHPRTLFRNRREKLDHWADDIRDINHKWPIAKDYGVKYGKWFLEVQEYFRTYLKEFPNEET
jgi:hypothetical protein